MLVDQKAAAREIDSGDGNDAYPDYAEDLLSFCSEVVTLEERHAITAMNIQQRIKSSLESAAEHLIEHANTEENLE